MFISDALCNNCTIYLFSSFLKLLIKSITHFLEVCNSIEGCCGLIEKKIWGLNIFYEFITIMILNQTSFIAYGK